ncbi:MAG: DNA replication protein [Rhodospirillales bacterium]|nr:DNA replication protein [Rhodospirillales bacterium]
MRQLALPFAETAQPYTAEDFCPAPSNAAARDWLARPEAWSNGRLVLWGEAGCGKTHLLHIWAQARQAQIVEGATLRGLVRPTGPVAVDDADLVPDPAALLHLLNAAAEEGFPVLLACRQPPARMGYKLADLTSRLRASASVEIRAPEDDLLEALLTRFAAARQLNLPIQVRNLLLLHLPRAPAFYREAVARLDRMAMDGGARITRPMAAAMLAEMLDAV